MIDDIIEKNLKDIFKASQRATEKRDQVIKQLVKIVKLQDARMKALSDRLEEHVHNKCNPHDTTSCQVDAFPDTDEKDDVPSPLHFGNISWKPQPSRVLPTRNIAEGKEQPIARPIWPSKEVAAISIAQRPTKYNLAEGKVQPLDRHVYLTLNNWGGKNTTKICFVILQQAMNGIQQLRDNEIDNVLLDGEHTHVFLTRSNLDSFKPLIESMSANFRRHALSEAPMALKHHKDFMERCTLALDVISHVVGEDADTFEEAAKQLFAQEMAAYRRELGPKPAASGRAMVFDLTKDVFAYDDDLIRDISNCLNSVRKDELECVILIGSKGQLPLSKGFDKKLNETRSEIRARFDAYVHRHQGAASDEEIKDLLDVFGPVLDAVSLVSEHEQVFFLKQMKKMYDGVRKPQEAEPIPHSSILAPESANTRVSTVILQLRANPDNIHEASVYVKDLMKPEEAPSVVLRSVEELIATLRSGKYAMKLVSDNGQAQDPSPAEPAAPEAKAELFPATKKLDPEPIKKTRINPYPVNVECGIKDTSADPIAPGRIDVQTSRPFWVTGVNPMSRVYLSAIPGHYPSVDLPVSGGRQIKCSCGFETRVYYASETMEEVNGVPTPHPALVLWQQHIDAAAHAYRNNQRAMVAEKTFGATQAPEVAHVSEGPHVTVVPGNLVIDALNTARTALVQARDHTKLAMEKGKVNDADEANKLRKTLVNDFVGPDSMFVRYLSPDVFVGGRGLLGIKELGFEVYQDDIEVVPWRILSSYVEGAYTRRNGARQLLFKLGDYQLAHRNCDDNLVEPWLLESNSEKTTKSPVLQLSTPELAQLHGALLKRFQDCLGSGISM
jgi:hypothetical protein